MITRKPANLLAICTYNRADSLRCTLGSVEQALAHCDRADWELLVIDNNSTDHTAEVCREFESTLGLRYLFEPKQGLSYARNRAIAACQSDLLVFTDDDVVVDEYWLAVYGKSRTNFPATDYFGGKVVPLWNKRKPKWLKDERMPLVSGLLVNYDLGHANRTLSALDPLPFGASFAVTRRLFEKTGCFRSDLGVKGNVPARGEEADYLSRARELGFEGAYLATALCRHPVEPGRLALTYLYRYGVQKGIAEMRMANTALKEQGIRTELMYGFRGLVQLAKGRGDRFRQCVINMGIQRGLRSAGEANPRKRA